MEENIMDDLQSLNEGSEQDTNPDEMVDPEQDNQSAEELAKAKEVAINQKIRAEKAEAELKKLKSAKPEKETPKKSEYSLSDIRALADVHDDDVEEVVEYAKFKGITIAEAKKSTVIRTLLREKTEERTTAEASNTAKVKRGSSAVSDESLIERFKSGNLDEKDIEKAAEAMINSKRAKR